MESIRSAATLGVVTLESGQLLLQELGIFHVAELFELGDLQLEGVDATFELSALLLGSEVLRSAALLVAHLCDLGAIAGVLVPLNGLIVVLHLVVDVSALVVDLLPNLGGRSDLECLLKVGGRRIQLVERGLALGEVEVDEGIVRLLASCLVKPGEGLAVLFGTEPGFAGEQVVIEAWCNRGQSLGDPRRAIVVACLFGVGGGKYLRRRKSDGD